MFRIHFCGHNKIWGATPPVTTSLGRGAKMLKTISL